MKTGISSIITHQLDNYYSMAEITIHLKPIKHQLNQPSYLLPPASCLLPPASCLLPPAENKI